MRNFLHVFLIFCFVLVSVSPACKFISGQLTEICGADGSVKSMSVPQELLAFLPDQGDDQPHDEDEHSLKQDCMFCFAHTHFQAALPTLETVQPLNMEREYFAHLNSDFIYRHARLYQPRGPPVSS